MVLTCILLISDVEHIFYVPVGHLYIFFEKMSTQSLCPFLIRFFAVELYEFYIYSEYYLLTRYIICKYFLP